MTEEEVLATVESALEKVRLECEMHGVVPSRDQLTLIREGIVMGVTEVEIRKRQATEDRRGEDA